MTLEPTTWETLQALKFALEFTPFNWNLDAGVSLDLKFGIIAVGPFSVTVDWETNHEKWSDL